MVLRRASHKWSIRSKYPGANAHRELAEQLRKADQPHIDCNRHANWCTRKTENGVANGKPTWTTLKVSGRRNWAFQSRMLRLLSSRRRTCLSLRPTWPHEECGCAPHWPNHLEAPRPRARHAHAGEAVGLRPADGGS